MPRSPKPRPRRTYGSGSVYQRPDGRWRASVRYPDGTRRSLAAADEADARAKLRQLLAADTGAKSPRVAAPPLTLGAYLAEWHAGLGQADTTKRTTVARYALDVRRWTDRYGDVPLGALTVPQVQRALADWRQTLAPATVRHARAVLSAALHEAQRRRLLEINVADLARPPRVEPRTVPPVTVAQARALLAAFADHPLGPLVTTALGTALRQGELLALTWADLDLDAGTVTVARRVYPLAGGYDTDTVKRSRSRGLVPLPAFVVEALRAHRQAQLAQRLKAGRRWRDANLVFSTATGGTLNGPSVTHRFEKQLAAAGLPVITFHDLRRAALTLLANLGVSLRVTQEIARHAHVQTTAGVYALVTPASHREAAATLDRALRDP